MVVGSACSNCYGGRRAAALCFCLHVTLLLLLLVQSAPLTIGFRTFHLRIV
jgi:hypothetical protein